MTAPELLQSNKQTVHIKARLRYMFVTTDTVMIQIRFPFLIPFVLMAKRSMKIPQRKIRSRGKQH